MSLQDKLVFNTKNNGVSFKTRCNQTRVQSLIMELGLQLRQITEKN